MPTLKYFPETGKLFFEPDFLEFLESANHDFLFTFDYKNWDNMIGMDESFSLSLEQWRYKSEKSKHFVSTVAEKLTKQIYKNWKAFEEGAFKENENALQEFKNELYQLKPLIQKTDYLKPVAKEVIELLGRIAAHYNATVAPDYTSEVGGEIKTFVPLKWNANINVLATIFYELRTKKVAENKGVYLDATDKQLIDFISRNFVDKNDKPIEPNSIKTILQPSKHEKRATKTKINLDKY